MKSFKVFLIGVLFLCITVPVFAKNVPTPKDPLIVDGNLSITFSRLENMLEGVVLDEMRYTSKDDALVFFRVGCKAKNISQENIENASIGSVELLCIDEKGNFDIRRSHNAGMPSFGKPKILKPGKSIKEVTFFMYNRNTTPIAFVANGNTILMLIPETDERYELAQNHFEKLKKIELVMLMARFSTFEEISSYLQENELTIKEKNNKGLTLFLYSVIYGNIDLLDGLIAAGDDINQAIYRGGFVKTFPINIAVEQKNPVVIRKLFNAGANLTKSPDGTDSAIAIAIRNDAVELLPLFKELGVDFKTLEIPMANGSPLPVRIYAERRGRKEILEFLDGL
ncbi:MAG TPA: ankyrin repeat domain-containing protein [Treponema sp.]|nr:ankyrin repeat domain-containing protein [Treponema sp.]HKL85585.1 hypothetical protein [Treponemataceae bacterium]